MKEDFTPYLNRRHQDRGAIGRPAKSTRVKVLLSSQDIKA